MLLAMSVATHETTLPILLQQSVIYVTLTKFFDAVTTTSKHPYLAVQQEGRYVIHSAIGNL